MFEEDLNIRVIVRDQKPISFDAENLELKVLNDFKHFLISQKSTEKYYFWERLSIFRAAIN